MNATFEQMEARRKWLNALRSGKYKQIYGHLSNGCGGACALGVACEELVPEPYTRTATWAGPNFTDDIKLRLFHDEMIVLPYEVTLMLGLESTSPSAATGKTISHYNDIEHKTLEEIADIFEPLLMDPAYTGIINVYPEDLP